MLLKPKVVAQLTFMPLIEDRANLLDDVVVKLDEVVGTNLRQESTTILTSFQGGRTWQDRKSLEIDQP